MPPKADKGKKSKQEKSRTKNVTAKQGRQSTVRSPASERMIDNRTDSREQDEERIELEFRPANGRGIQRVIARRNGAEIFADEINVGRAKHRERFIAALAMREGVEVNVLDYIDERMIEEAAKPQSAADSQPASAGGGDGDPPPDPLADTPQEVIEDAKRMLQNPDLISELERDFTKIGIAGEAILALSIFFVIVSRLLEKPLAFCTKAASSSGKSHTAGKVHWLIPSEHIFPVTEISPKALYNLPAGSLRHKYVYVGERKHGRKGDSSDTADATVCLREMLSESRIQRIVTIPGVGARLVAQEGPIAYGESTTLEEIFYEDATRMLPLTTDESNEQTERINNAQKIEVSGTGITAEVKAGIVAKHQAAQRLLAPVEVLIPYANQLAFPSERVTSRRALPMLFGMISAVALFRQFQKNVVEGGIDADLEDYRIAYRIMLPVLQRMMKPLSKGARELYRGILAHRGDQTVEEWRFTLKDAEGWTKAKATATRNHVNDLCGAGLVIKCAQRSGHADPYRLASDDGGVDGASIGLTTPDDLATRIAANAKSNAA